MNVRKNLATIPPGIVFTISLLALTAVSQERQASKSSSYAVGPGAVVSITNNYGPVSVQPSGSSQVDVNTGSGRITYDGDPGRIGEYLLSSHSGNLEVSIPASAWVEIKARSIKNQSDPEFPTAGKPPALGQINLMGKPGKIGSRFELRSFSGKIHLKRP